MMQMSIYILCDTLQSNIINVSSNQHLLTSQQYTHIASMHKNIM